MDNRQGPTVQPWNSAQWYVVAWTTGEEFGGEEWIQIYVCLSPFAVPLKLSQHYLSAIPQNKIKGLKKKNPALIFEFFILQ